MLLPLQPENFPYKDEIAALSNVCLVLIVLLFISCILAFKVTGSVPVRASYIISAAIGLIYGRQSAVVELDEQTLTCQYRCKACVQAPVWT